MTEFWSPRTSEICIDIRDITGRFMEQFTSTDFTYDDGHHYVTAVMYGGYNIDVVLWFEKQIDVQSHFIASYIGTIGGFFHHDLWYIERSGALVEGSPKSNASTPTAKRGISLDCPNLSYHACPNDPTGSTPIYERRAGNALRITGYWFPQNTEICLDIRDRWGRPMAQFLSTQFVYAGGHHYVTPMACGFYNIDFTFRFESAASSSTEFVAAFIGTISGFFVEDAWIISSSPALVNQEVAAANGSIAVSKRESSVSAPNPSARNTCGHGLATATIINEVRLGGLLSLTGFWDPLRSVICIDIRDIRGVIMKQFLRAAFSYNNGRHYVTPVTYGLYNLDIDIWFESELEIFTGFIASYIGHVNGYFVHDAWFIGRNPSLSSADTPGTNRTTVHSPANISSTNSSTL
ncbi:uncharacterized protein KY384_001277 [Bacidia gigantensis]|uniref:uncharacterized protein n=1 Tax=Bacidia gigantensis TaxID=2732470 RepID=UPI001D04C2E5|nr:uncharacterized protein KY384_001277 [Bacidia gigantensis]KAG8533537.1 hypothetical protein KY384_001277 [Bacidia gigantensis]